PRQRLLTKQLLLDILTGATCEKMPYFLSLYDSRNRVVVEQVSWPWCIDVSIEQRILVMILFLKAENGRCK
ncbi:MAG: hypothetical protein KKG11_07860, partial [Gammaproteobacteria bacterium]|nr:hypothetical protein [Gammaproteobacteria bacterium]